MIALFHLTFFSVKRHTIDIGAVRPKPVEILQNGDKGCICEKYPSSLIIHFRQE